MLQSHVLSLSTTTHPANNTPPLENENKQNTNTHITTTNKTKTKTNQNKTPELQKAFALVEVLDVLCLRFRDTTLKDKLSREEILEFFARAKKTAAEAAAVRAHCILYARTVCVRVRERKLLKVNGKRQGKGKRNVGLRFALFVTHSSFPLSSPLPPVFPVCAHV